MLAPRRHERHRGEDASGERTLLHLGGLQIQRLAGRPAEYDRDDGTLVVLDDLHATDRQRLVPFLPRMVGTAGDGQDEARSYLALDWLIRTYTPAWLDLAGLTAEATALRDLRRIVDTVTAQAAGLLVQDARSEASAARDAAWDAARDAAWASRRAGDGSSHA